MKWMRGNTKWSKRRGPSSVSGKTYKWKNNATDFSSLNKFSSVEGISTIQHFAWFVDCPPFLPVGILFFPCRFRCCHCTTNKILNFQCNAFSVVYLIWIMAPMKQSEAYTFCMNAVRHSLSVFLSHPPSPPPSLCIFLISRIITV